MADDVAVHRLDIAYDGSGFHGFARQPSVRTVQGEVERAIEVATGLVVETTGAGRTDTGVHARRQVMSFVAEAVLDPTRLARAITGIVGPEIVALSCRVVDDDFDARFSALSRTYRYRILVASHPDPLCRHTTWHVSSPLDIDAMNSAVAHLVGEHDFASFCRRREGATSERTVIRADWSQVGDLLVFEIEATAFCHQMVRSITGLAVDVGRGRVDASSVPLIVEACDRSKVPQIAPPHGLILWDVRYP